MITIHLEQLKYIVEVYKTGSLTKAAGNCYISVPGISQSITKLEKELGVKIFKRYRKGIIPTREGMGIINKAFEVLLKVEEIKARGQIEDKAVEYSMKVSASPSLIILLLKSVQSFKKDYINVDVEITERMAPDIIDSVKQEEIDFGLTVINDKVLLDNRDLGYELLLKGEKYVCVNKNSPLASLNTIKPQDLLNQNIVLYNGYFLKSFIYRLFDKYGKVNILFESNQLEIIKRTVAEGLAVTFFNNLILEDDFYILNGDIVAVPLDAAYQDDVSFGIIYLKKRLATNVATEFLKYIIHQNNKG